MFAIELEFLKYLETLRTEFLNTFFQAVTILGEEVLLIFLVVTLWFVVNKKLAQRMLFITLTSLSINGIIKNIARVPRPFTKGISCVREDTATGYSFPSGHTQGFTTWSTVSAIQFRKIWLQLLVGILSVLVGFSRMYLGAHYPSDVLVAMVLVISIAYLGNKLYDKVEDPKKLYLGTVLLLSPFFVYFLFEPESLFADAYKTYGMLCGLMVVSFLDERVEGLSYDIPLWKKILRVVIGVVFAFALKEGIKVLNVFDTVSMSLIFDAVRYFVVVFAVGFLCPLVFKKINL